MAAQKFPTSGDAEAAQVMHKELDELRKELDEQRTALATLDTVAGCRVSTLRSEVPATELKLKLSSLCTYLLTHSLTY